MGLFSVLKDLFSKNGNVEPVSPTPFPESLQPFAFNIPQSNEAVRIGKIKHRENTLFQIVFYGNTDKNSEIIDTDYAPALLRANEPISGASFILYDGCIHGYNPLFVYEFTEQQLNRRADKIYTDKYGNDLFEIEVEVWYQQVGFDEEMLEETDEMGMIELPSGRSISLDKARCDAFNSIEIKIRSPKGRSKVLFSMESA